jgi:hypothetical protein
VSAPIEVEIITKGEETKEKIEATFSTADSDGFCLDFI